MPPKDIIVIDALASYGLDATVRATKSAIFQRFSSVVVVVGVGRKERFAGGGNISSDLAKYRVISHGAFLLPLLPSLRPTKVLFDSPLSTFSTANNYSSLHLESMPGVHDHQSAVRGIAAIKGPALPLLLLPDHPPVPTKSIEGKHTIRSGPRSGLDIHKGSACAREICVLSAESAAVFLAKVHAGRPTRLPSSL